MSITFTDGVTPLNKVVMDHVVQDDEIQAATVRIIRNLLAAGDTQAAWQVRGDGRMDWGPGGSTALDTNLYRPSAGQLKTDGVFYAGSSSWAVGGFFFNPATAAGVAFNSLVSGEGNARFRALVDGKMEWGPGNTAADTNLYRKSATVLHTDQNFEAGGYICANPGSVANQLLLYNDGRLCFGSALDTSLYRSAAQTLKTDHTLRVGESIVVDDSSTGYGKVYFGNALDTNLYRRTAALLATDGAFVASKTITCEENRAGTVAIYTANLANDGYALYVKRATDAGGVRFLIDSVGGVCWGDGTGWIDTSFTRWTAGWITCNSNFQVPNILFLGSAGDCGMKRDTSQGDARIYTDQAITSLGTTSRRGVSNGAGGQRMNFAWVGGASVEVWVDATYLGQIGGLSDVRLKQAVESLASSWETVKAMRPISFRWRDWGAVKDDGRRHIGFSAQDLQALDPALVSEIHDPSGADQPLSLNITEVVATLANALKEALTRIEVLEGRTA